MATTSIAGTNEMVETPSLEDTTRTLTALVAKVAVMSKDNEEKARALLNNSLREPEELLENLRKEKNDEINKLKEDYDRLLKEKNEEIEKLKNEIEAERKAKIPPKFPAKIIGKLCKKDSVDSLRKTIVVTEPSAPIPVGQQVFVKVDVKEAGYEALDITVKDPDNHEVATRVAEINEGLLQVAFKARLPGRYYTHVSYAGTYVPGSLFSAEVFDLSKIIVGQVSAWNETVNFDINFSKAGPEKEEVAVNDEIISRYSYYCGSDGYNRYKFTRDETKDYIITVRFNGETVPGTPIHVKSGPTQK